MSAAEDDKNQNSLDPVQEILERFGVAGNADWMAVVLFARNLVTSMDLFTQEQKAQLQAKTFEQMAKKPLDHKRLARIVGIIQGFLLDNAKMADLRAQLKNERQGFDTLLEEMGRVFTDIRASSEERQTNIQRMGADTEEIISGGASKADMVRKFRGMITDMVAQAREDARSWEERAKQLERTVNFDTLLSELFSRRALDSQLIMALERCKRGNKALSMLFLDVDHFKVINDTCGHQVGDGVLRVLAAIVSAHAMQFKGYAARFGGEEIVILCEGLDEATATARAEAIRMDVARCPFAPHCESTEPAEPMHITVSIGVAQLFPGQTSADLVLAADQAMYAAKLQGRNRVVAHSTLVPQRIT